MGKDLFFTSKNSYHKVDLTGDFTSKLELNKSDVVTCFETIEHIADDELFLKKIMQFLKPGGTFLISSPNEDVIPCTQNPFYPGGRNPYHYRHYTPGELKQLLKNSGLSILDAYTQCPNNMVRGENGFSIVYVCTNSNLDKKIPMDSLDKGIEKLNLLRMRKTFSFLATNASNSTEITKIDSRIDELIQSYDSLMTAFNLIDQGQYEKSLVILEAIDKSLCPESYFWIGLIAQTKGNYFHSIEMYSKILDNKKRLSSVIANFAEEQLVKAINQMANA